MAVFIVLWPYLLTTKLKSVIRHNLGHSKVAVLTLKGSYKHAIGAPRLVRFQLVQSPVKVRFYRE